MTNAQLQFVFQELDRMTKRQNELCLDLKNVIEYTRELIAKLEAALPNIGPIGEPVCVSEVPKQASAPETPTNSTLAPNPVGMTIDQFRALKVGDKFRYSGISFRICSVENGCCEVTAENISGDLSETFQFHEREYMFPILS